MLGALWPWLVLRAFASGRADLLALDQRDRDTSWFAALLGLVSSCPHGFSAEKK